MGNDKLLTEVVKRAAAERDGRLTLCCSDAFRIVAEHQATLADVGRICNENKIKIVQCQLGCFP